jgi:hypothetical protein
MTNDLNTEILDTNEEGISNGKIDFDLKMVRVISLTYFIYGIVYYLELSSFLVPLPMAYYMLPFAAVIMFVRSASSFKSIILLFIPILVLKDLWINVNPIIVEPLLFASIIVWFLWGVSFLKIKQHKDLKYSFLAAISQFLIFLIMIPGHWLIFPIAMFISLILLTIFVRANLENVKATVVLRASFLIQMMYVMYLLQMVSNFQNS